MKIEHSSLLTSNRFFTTISPKNRFEENLRLTLSLRGNNIIENFDWAFVDLHFQLMDNKKETKRIFLNRDDFRETAFSIKINTGDLLSKIRIGLYFKKEVSSNQFLDKILVADNDDHKISNLIFLPTLRETIQNREPIEFIEKLRVMSIDNFQDILDTELPALHALMEKAPERVYYYWALADKIIKITATSQLPLSYLDSAAESYFNEYHDGKFRLGFNLENILV
ncbi:MAG: hypothetical protein IPL10_18090 [Bacteroidetes bacterium]|nr:hypothetical protein [Bacteroidota bacterium]